MVKFAIIADDLTGSNATCSLLKKVGLNALSMIDFAEEVNEDIDVVSYSTLSRAVHPEEAYEHVKKALKYMKSLNPMFYSKRIDSTMRGNISYEINAFFEELPGYMGICVPAFPSSKRIVINGTMLVDGNLLTNTDAGRDPKMPVSSDNVSEILKDGLNGKIKSINLCDIEKGASHLSKLIKGYYDEGINLLVFDAVLDSHLEIIGRAVFDSKIKFFSVDPGPFSMHIARSILDKENLLSKVLMICGSVTDITIRQLRDITNNQEVEVIKVSAKNLIDEDKRDLEIENVVKKADSILDENNLLLVTTTPFEEGDKRLDLKEISKEKNITIDEISILISSGLGEIGKEILKSNHSFAGVYTSGGDITVELVKLLHSSGIVIREELEPLVAYGRLTGGDFDNLRIVTKGGMVGDTKTMEVCLNKLSTEVEEN